MEPRSNRPETAREEGSGRDGAPGTELPDPNHIVVEPVEGAAQAFAAAVAGAFSVILPAIGNLFDDDGSVSAAAAFGLVIFALLIGWGILQALGRARQRKVFWEATRSGLVVHMDNVGALNWDQIRAIEPVRAGPPWLTGAPVTAIRIYPWMPMDVRRRMKPDEDVKYFVRRPVMDKDDRFLRLPVWQTKMREYGEEMTVRLKEWHTGSTGL
ncbi:MAG: hypothetical protein ACLFWF_01205 [Alphaproteobacteria bacterium]